MSQVSDGVKPLVICADDYGHSSPTSEVIVRLIEAGLINATTCLVESSRWRDDGEALRRAGASRSQVSTGLHLNLTERLGAQTDVFSPARLALDGSPSLIDRIFERFLAQWEAFTGVMGRAPDFLDGHQHVHLAFAPRAALFRLTERVGFRGWVRQCRTTSARRMAKRLVLDPLSVSFSAEARRRKLVLNPGFGGLRQFRQEEDIVGLWIQDLSAMREGGVLMVHPGAETPGDCIGAFRRQEAEALPWVTDMLARHGLSMQVEPRAPW